MTGREAIRALGQGGGGVAVATPFALPSAARIQERDWEDFLEDPTQLANGLRDLHQAIAPGGLVVSDVDTLVEQADGGIVAGAHARAVVEAVGRLRASLGESVALVAAVPGAVRLADAGVADGAGAVQEFGKELFSVGADVVLVVDEGAPDPGLSTLGNIARFHQGVVAVTGDPAAVTAPLVPVTERSVDDPVEGEGLVITTGPVPRDRDITVLEDWVEIVEGG